MNPVLNESMIEAYLNQPLDRRPYASEKYDLSLKLFGTTDLTPLWVADMDLPTAQFIIEAIQNRLAHPNLGYTLADQATKQSIIDWHSSLKLKEQDILFTHNVANGIFLSVQAFTKPDEKVLVMPPIYPPFFEAVTKQARQLVELPLILNNQQQYQIDFDQLNYVLKQHDIKLLLFCNPQNPSGRVWSALELKQLATVCIENNVLLVSDEIHSDLTLPRYQHTSLASLSEIIADQTITLSSPGKTFNLGGLQLGYALISNSRLRRQFLNTCQSLKIEGLTLFGYEAIKAAYSDNGKTWQASLLTYLDQNITLFCECIERYYPQVTLIKPQASYLVWLNFEAYFPCPSALDKWLVEEVKVGLSDGKPFQGSAVNDLGWKRINLAISREKLEEVLDRFKAASYTLEEVSQA